MYDVFYRVQLNSPVLAAIEIWYNKQQRQGSWFQFFRISLTVILLSVSQVIEIVGIMEHMKIHVRVSN